MGGILTIHNRDTYQPICCEGIGVCFMASNEVAGKCQGYSTGYYRLHTVDGRILAPPWMVETLSIMG